MLKCKGLATHHPFAIEAVTPRRPFRVGEKAYYHVTSLIANKDLEQNEYDQAKQHGNPEAEGA